MLVALGVLAGVLQLVSTAPYLRDILRGRTRPHRASWAIWTTLSVIVLFSQRADGASWSLVLVACQASACVAIVALAARRGVGGTSPVDIGLLALAGAGVVGWQVAGTPTLATACVLLADLIGLGMMLPKTHRDPWSETLSTFAIATGAAALAAVSVGSLDPALLAYPVYLALANLAVALLLAVRRRAVPSPVAAPAATSNLLATVNFKGLTFTP